MTNYHSRSGSDILKLYGRHTCLPVALLLPLKVSPPLLHHLKETRGCPLEFRKKWAAYLPSIMLCSWLPPLPPWVGMRCVFQGVGVRQGVVQTQASRSPKMLDLSWGVHSSSFRQGSCGSEKQLCPRLAW